MINTIANKNAYELRIFQPLVHVHNFLEIDVIAHHDGALMTNRTAETLWRKCVNGATTKESAE
jgi:hypothetical protein